MTTRAPFLSQRYGAYYHREVPEPDEELTSVGPRHAVRGLSAALLAPGHRVRCVDRPSQKRVKVLGEELVAFRDGLAATSGVLELHCSHRGTSLEYGQIESIAEYAAAITAGSLVSTARDARYARRAP